MKREPSNTSILHRHSKVDVVCWIIVVGLILTVVFMRIPISEMHLGTFPDSMTFQSQNVNFQNEVCSKSTYSHLTMHSIEEVEISKSIDELMTSRLVVGLRYAWFDDSEWQHPRLRRWWNHVKLWMSEISSDVILVGLYKSKLQEFVQLQTVLTLCEQETFRNNGQMSYLRLKASVKLHVD